MYESVHYEILELAQCDMFLLVSWEPVYILIPEYIKDSSAWGFYPGISLLVNRLQV